jgi:hypothetical protein
MANSFLPENEKGRGAIKQGMLASKDYITTGRMGIDSGLGGLRNDAGWVQGQRQFGGLLDQMGARMRGEAPSLAELQLQRGLGEAMRQQQSMAASATGANRAGSQRTAMRNMADMAAQTNDAQAMLRAQETAQAEQAFGQMLAQQQGLNMQREVGLGLGLEGLVANNFGTAYTRQRGQTGGWGADLLSAGIGGIAQGVGGAVTGAAIA